MDEPITDVVFVTDEKDTPEGYKAVSGLMHARFHAHATAGKCRFHVLVQTAYRVQ